MTTFTVLGCYDDTAQVFCHTVQADDAYDAMRVASIEMEGNDNLCIIGAMEGDHKIITPGCDNGLSAFACDLAEGA